MAFEQARDALVRRRQQLYDEIAGIDSMISLLPQHKAAGPHSAESRTAAVKPGEFKVLDDLWPAIQLILVRHDALSTETGLDAKVLEDELRQSGALDRYRTERTSRVHLITVSQHKDAARYDKATGKVWLLRKN